MHCEMPLDRVQRDEFTLHLGSIKRLVLIRIHRKRLHLRVTGVVSLCGKTWIHLMVALISKTREFSCSTSAMRTFVTAGVR